MKENLIDYNKILQECGFRKESAQQVLLNSVSYLQNCNTLQKSELYIFILSNITDLELLYCTLKEIDECFDERIIAGLLKVILLHKEEEYDSDLFINTKVLAIKAIAKFKDPLIVKTLLFCLNNKAENYKIRLACADSLGRIGDRFAVGSLINVVEDEDEKSIYVKESATFALGLLGDASAIDPLLSIMNAKQGLLGKFSFLKEKIVEALGRLNLNNKKIYIALKNALLDPSPMVRINAIEALMNSDFEDAENIIRKSLHDENEEVQKNALVALYNMIGSDILEEVISLPGYSKALKEDAQLILNEYEVN